MELWSKTLLKQEKLSEIPVAEMGPPLERKEKREGCEWAEGEHGTCKKEEWMYRIKASIKI